MKKIIGILLLTAVLASCKKQEQLGPDLLGLNGPVTFIEPFAASTNTVNFTTGGSVYFTARFKNDAAWTITLTSTGGAVKKITGISKEINSGNSTWFGDADAAPSFNLENVTATLTFQNVGDVVPVGPISITGKKVTDLPGNVLVSNFVTAPIKNFGTGTVLPNQWVSDFPITNNSQSVYGFPDGNKYLIMGDTTTPYTSNSARPHQGNGSPYVDFLLISPRNSQQNYGTYYPLYADPEKVYFNIMVYNTGSPTWLQISFYEVESFNPNSTTGNPSPDRHFDIKPNWQGWKLVSIKYSDLIPNSAEAAANIQPQKITDIQFVTLSTLTGPTMPTIPVKAAFDHVTFTHNKPYQP